MFKVAQKLCNYYKLCKNGEHSSVTEEIMSVKLPKLNVKYGDCNGDNEMELSEHGVSLRDNHRQGYSKRGL